MNITPITKAPRLTADDVHAAAADIAAAGGKVSSLEIYRHLGRGSLTTITNLLKTWQQEHPDTDNSAPPSPPLSSLPDSVRIVSEQLLAKLWNEATTTANHELEIQKAALKDAEAKTAERLQEAEAFSEEQEKTISALKQQIETLEAETQHITRLQLQLAAAEQHAKDLEERAIRAEKHAEILQKELQQAHETELQLTKENVELKTRLDAAIKNVLYNESRHNQELQEHLRTKKEAENARIAEQACQARLESAAREIEALRKEKMRAEERHRITLESNAKLQGQLETLTELFNDPGKTANTEPFTKIKQSTPKKAQKTTQQPPA